MGIIDGALDTTLLGYTRLGSTLRGIRIDEPFPEVAGREIMVTGATGGIGRAVTERLAANGAVVHAVGRSAEKLDRLVDEVDGTVIPYRADLSSMYDVTRLASDYRAAARPLHGLVNNVGVMPGERTVTDEGFELAYATNLLGQYILTEALLSNLEASSPARIVMVSSGGMYTEALTATNLMSDDGPYRPTAAYARTKRGQVVLAEAWSDRLRGRGVVATSMHPGWADTDGVRASLPTFRRLTGPLLRSPAEAADTIVWLVASDEAASIDGGFFHDRTARPTHRSRTTHDDPELRRRFLDRIETDAQPYLSTTTPRRGD
jgi:NAD(P)-dependent dehydrogenase (short-subunit alcohol dehydrogenase family)